jgi:inhibitor of KinA
MMPPVAADAATASAAPRFLNAGETALVVEFGETVDPAINDRVLALDAALRADPPAGTREFVPTYRSLMIHYDPLQIERQTLIGLVHKALAVSAARTAWHTAASYRIYMYGFAPGQIYLGGLPEVLAISRRPAPRPPHQPGAVLIGGGLCVITNFAMPTGWYVIGRTPERLYAAARADAFLFQAGDNLRFEAIDAATFLALERRVASGEVVARQSAA